MGKALRFIAYGCRHAPLSDPWALEQVLARIAAYKPHVVIDLGDGIEGNAASQWPDAKEINLSLADEFAADSAFCRSVRKAAPSAALIRLCGNHESALQKKGRIDPRLRALCQWDQQPELKNHWKVIPNYLYCARRGSYWLTPQVCFSHGYETTDSKVPVEAMYFTRNSPYALYTSAHTHRPHEVRPVCMGDLPMHRWYANVGCLREMSPDYMHRKRKWRWAQALMTGEAMPLKSPRMSKEWDARVEMLRTYDEAMAA